MLWFSLLYHNESIHTSLLFPQYYNESIHTSLLFLLYYNESIHTSLENNLNRSVLVLSRPYVIVCIHIEMYVKLLPLNAIVKVVTLVQVPQLWEVYKKIVNSTTFVYSFSCLYLMGIIQCVNVNVAGRVM